MKEDWCHERVDYKPRQTVEYIDEEIFVRDDELEWEFYLTHDGDLTAVDVPVAIQFVSDGDTVTDDLGQEFQDEWDGYAISVDPYTKQMVSDDSLKIPDAWDADNVDLEISVGDPEYWCTPKNVEGGQ